jgi:7-cyano-7-deazaguanine synthase in queuosine biosynthesis
MTLIAWSGGCDSTLVLWQTLQEQTLSSPSVRTIAVNHPYFNMPASNAREKKQRQVILKTLRKKGYRIDHQEVEIKADGFPKRKGGLGQPPLWLVFSVLYATPDEPMAFGYIRGDDIWHYRQYFKEAWDNLSIIVGHRKSELLFPLEWLDKADVIDELREAKLLSLVWYCADRGDKPCGKCSSCVTHQLGLAKLKMKSKIKVISSS